MHGFTAGVFLMKGRRWDEGRSMVDNGVEAVRNSTSFFKGLRVSEFDFSSCLGFQSTNEFVDKSFLFDFSELHCKLR